MTEQRSDLHLDAECAPLVQLALQQAGTAIVRRIRIRNTGPVDAPAGEIEVSLEPPIAPPVRVPYAPVAAGAELVIEGAPLKLSLRVSELAARDEGVRGSIRFSAPGAAPLERPIDVLPFDHWPGGGSPPDLLASVATPNHDGTARLLGHVRRVLDARGRDTSLEGYQRHSRERVLELAEAVYGSLGDARVTYANPPAGFARDGQRVRTVDRLLDEGVGTCLDLTLAMAGALEQIGLNALIVVIDGHAFPGVWLVDERLPATWTDEPSLIRNRVALGELAVFDSSAAVRGIPFREACAIAARHLDGQDFLFAVDVAATRAAGIRPLPLVRGAEPAPVEVGRGAGAAGLAASGALPTLPVGPAQVAGLTDAIAPTERVARWKERLLDLSLNNRLLNQRGRKATLPLLAPAPAAIERALRKGQLTLAPRPAPREGDDPQAAATGALDGGTLVVDAAEADLFARATELYRTARTFADDAGVVPLFLALGALRWVESPSSKVERLAPVVLVPVTIVRDSVRGPFRIRAAEDDAIVNMALLTMLQREFGVVTAGLDVLPEDGDGVHVEQALQNLRHAIRDVPGFEVRPTASIDLLAFAKYLMWADLEQNLPQLRRSPVLARLLEKDAPAVPQPAPFADPATLDDARPAAEDLSVVDADSTQLAALWSAVDGNSFILQGPPGTGKSQTITNLIAQAIARGRSVLFVAEKRAALEVVENRLERVGLGPFVLEAHSDRATRGSVVEQLGEALALRAERTTDEWERHARELGALRETLNAHARRLNTPGPWGESLQQALGRLLELADAPDVTLELPQEPPRDLVTASRAALAAFETEAASLHDPASHPWRTFDPPPWTPAWQADVERSLDGLADGVRRFSDALAPAAQALGMAAVPHEPEALPLVAELALTAPAVQPALLDARAAEVEAHLAELRVLVAERRQRATALAPVFRPSLFASAELPSWRAAIVRWMGAFFLVRFFALLGVRRGLRAHAAARLPSARELAPALESAECVAALDRRIGELDPTTRALFGPLARGADSEIAALEQHAAWAARWREARVPLGDAAAGATRAVLEADVRLAPGSAARAALENLKASTAALAQVRSAVDALLRPRAPWDTGPPVERSARIEALRRATSLLRDWTLFRAACRELERLGAAALVDGVLAGRVTVAGLRPAWEKALRRAWVYGRFESDPALASFRGQQQDALLLRFRALDREAQQVAQREIRARLAARLPDPTAPGQMEVLRRELRKRRAHMPVRRLFADLRDVLLRLKPCVLMSPLTVARHLDPTLPPFDLVIFDEASQIPPWDAVGALARGKQAIVVGDSRQLPPTSFFAKEGAEEADDDERVDLESVLDECGAAGLPEVLLGWHYRSRHESLIAFSNAKYYRNRLHIFPSPHSDSPRLGVKWVHVPDGFYDRAQSRTNTAEAQALVDAVCARLLDPATAHQTIAVVTFSQAQQRCVEDHLDRRRRDNAALEAALAAHAEPLIVKNLENIQGDERDVVYFSIGYGPDRTGRVSMAFGPLNRDGGERRLNVAVTRARELLLVFSTLRPEQMDLSRTSAVGVHHLKAFLEYAATGPSALAAESTISAHAEYGSPFEEQVAAALERRGWRTQSQVGVAGYRIDLGVVHPEHPGRYLAAIECDGAAYHSAATARDRDRIRQAVLERLGWSVLRIWSTDWWHAPDRVLDDVCARLEALRSAPAVAAPPPTPAPAPPAAEEPAVVETDAASAADVGAVWDAAPEWPAYASPWSPLPVLRGAAQEHFYLPQADGALQGQVQRLVEAAGPISLAHLGRHVARAWGFSAVSAQARGRVEDAARAAGLHVTGDAVFASPQQAAARHFRYAQDGAGSDRDFDDVPLIELAAALAWVVDRAVRVDVESAQRHAARVFGVTRVGSAVRERLDAAARLGAERGWLAVEPDGTLTSRAA